jgi:hypothetical protein
VLPKARAAVVRFLLWLGAVHTSSIGSRLAGSAGPQGIMPAAHSVVIGLLPHVNTSAKGHTV